MKRIFRYCLVAAFMLSGMGKAIAQECAMPIRVVIDSELANVPVASQALLYQALTRITTQSGLSTESAFSPTILTAHVDVLDKSNIAGPPVQIVYNLGVTLYIADALGKQKYATEYIEMPGVGSNETKSFNDAFKRINTSNAKVASFIEQGRKKLLNYYDTQYNNIIKEAQRLAAQEDYGKAIAMTVSVPTCSKGYDAVMQVGISIYNKYRDKCNLYLLNRARAIWAAGQDFDAAAEAARLLAEIDPEAACHADATALLNEIKKNVRADIDFEMREKYHDAVKLEQQRIDCMKAVGVAYGKGQQPTTTNVMWLR